MVIRLRSLWMVPFVAALALLAAAQDVTLDSDTLSGLPIRAIGPNRKSS